MFVGYGVWILRVLGLLLAVLTIITPQVINSGPRLSFDVNQTGSLNRDSSVLFTKPDGKTIRVEPNPKNDYVAGHVYCGLRESGNYLVAVQCIPEVAGWIFAPLALIFPELMLRGYIRAARKLGWTFFTRWF